MAVAREEDGDTGAETCTLSAITIEMGNWLCALLETNRER